MLLTKLSVPVGLAITLCAAAVGAGGAVMATKEKVIEVAKQTEAHEVQIERLREQRADDREQVIEIRGDVKAIAKALERIENRLGTHK